MFETLGGFLFAGSLIGGFLAFAWALVQAVPPSHEDDERDPFFGERDKPYDRRRRD